MKNIFSSNQSLQEVITLLHNKIYISFSKLLIVEESIKIIRGNAAVDATILTKDESVEGVAEYFGCELKDIAFIGDEIADLPLLTKKGLGFAGTVANAQERVKETLINQTNSYVSSLSVFDGFLDFYSKSIDKKIKLVLSDRDGVLKDGDKTFGNEFTELALKMGQEQNPYVIILTGSSYQQNLPFMEKYGLNPNLNCNPKIVEYPYLILAEGGAIHINVLTGNTNNYVADICPDLLKILKKDFEPKVKSKIEEKVLSEFNLYWAKNYNDQQGKIYHVKDKLSMVTFNIPRTFANGESYRKSSESEKLRDKIVEIMVNTANELNLPYDFL